jgi:hypothetical protein
MVDLVKSLGVLEALDGKVAPKEQVVDSCLREERHWIVLLLHVEDFLEMRQIILYPRRRSCPLICRAIESSSKEEQTINESSTYNSVCIP